MSIMEDITTSELIQTSAGSIVVTLAYWYGRLCGATDWQESNSTQQGYVGRGR